MGTTPNEEEPPAYQPDGGFELDSRGPLFNFTSVRSGSTELWLMQWPHNDLPEINGKEVCISLDDNGCSGSFEDLSGKAYDIGGNGIEPGGTVFMSSASENEIVGNIRRRVSLVHYPDPKEIERRDAEKKAKRQSQLSSRGSSMKNSSQRSSGVTKSSRQKSVYPSKSTYSSWENPSSSKRSPRSPGSSAGGSSRDSKRHKSTSTTTTFTGPSQR